MIPQIGQSQRSPSTMSFELFLFINGIENLPVQKLGDCSRSSFMVKIEWGGGGRKLGFLHLQGLKKNCTSKQQAQPDGTLSWKEGFNCICKLKRMNSQTYKSWIVNLEVQEYDKNLNGKPSVIGKSKIDIAEYAPPKGKNMIRITIRCNIKDQTAETVLKVKLHFMELSTRGRIPFTLPRAHSFHHAFSCVGSQRNYSADFSSHRSIYPSLADSSSEDELEFTYRKIAASNILLGAELPTKFEYHEEEQEQQYVQRQTPDRIKRQPSLVRLLSTKAKLSLKPTKHPKGEPLLNKSYSDVGGDDIDIERHQQSSTQCATPSLGTELQAAPQNRGFEDEGLFEVGVWENRRFGSRDGEMELVTDVFLATIDQRSEKAAGGSACTVLSVVVADWLHGNPKSLPLRCQFDELIHRGCTEWRKLCADGNHKEKFSDQHFDLDTVLDAGVRRLGEIKTMSFVGFFGLHDMPDSLHFLQETMTFDSIWDELLRPPPAAEERIYIASWNDHFFVLKIGSDGAVYLIDTLGERLLEGCNQAYILKFDEQSVIYKRRSKQDKDDDDDDDDDDSCEEVVLCEGIICCREYIKGFLAAVPLRELQEDAKRGVVMEEAILHRLLQIEFHYTAPSIEEGLINDTENR